MIKSKLPYYLELFEKQISLSYQRHEETFDPESLHGRFHILRCLFLAEFILEVYFQKGVVVDQDEVYLSVLFHDIAREGNGFDEWEEESAGKCMTFMLLNNYSQKKSLKTSSLILKIEPFTIEGQILHDVDVLDYNRFFPACYFDDMFEASRLRFLSDTDITGLIDSENKKQLIKYAQDLVVFTELISISSTTIKIIEVLNNFKNEYK